MDLREWPPCELGLVVVSRMGSIEARVTAALWRRSTMGDDAAEPCADAGAEDASTLGAVWVERMCGSRG